MTQAESAQAPRSGPSLAQQLRRALLLSFFPFLVGVVVVVIQLVEGSRRHSARSWLLSLGLAWFVFLIVVLGLSVGLSRLRGPALALRTTVECPRCHCRNLIITYTCAECEHELGVPKVSRPTYVYTVIGFVCFKGILLFQPHWWLF